jgi:hypothetical protein
MEKHRKTAWEVTRTARELHKLDPMVVLKLKVLKYHHLQNTAYHY